MEQIFKIGSVSNAARARRVLSAKGIRGRMTKTDGTDEGCAWGLAVDGKEAQTAAAALRSEGIRYEAL